jgi:hypothetical protein
VGTMVKNRFKFPASFKGEYLGVLILAVAQFLVGSIHAVIGLIFIFSGFNDFYNIYTFCFGIFTLFFGYGLWVGKK